MGIIKRLITRFWPTGFLFLIGFLLVIYVSLGIFYVQQGAQQKEFEEQIVKLDAVVAKPLPSVEDLQAEYEEVNRALAPIIDIAAIAILVGIAEESGIDVAPDADKFRVPSAATRGETVGGSSYQVLSFSNVSVQGDYDKVMAFISVLDSGETLETMVLKRVVITQTGTETIARLDVDIYTKPEG